MLDSCELSTNAQFPQDAPGQFKYFVAKRGQLKTRITKFRSFLDAFDINVTPKLQIELRLSKVQDAWNDFEKVQFQLELLDPSGNQEDERDSFENTYFDVVTLARTFIDNSCDKTPLSVSSSRAPSPRQDYTERLNADLNKLQSYNSPSEPVTVISQQMSSQPIIESNCHCSPQPSNSTHIQNKDFTPEVRLPTLSLPTFDGSYAAWPTFHELFTSLIHDNDTLSSIVKFQYLRSSLKGEASAIIDSITLSKENYLVAWSLLTQRFHNKNLIILRHVRELCSIKKMERINAPSLHMFITHLLKHIRSLKVLGQPVDSWDTLLIHILAARLDPGTYKEWQTKCASQTEELPSLNDFVVFLQNRCHVLEAVATSLMQPSLSRQQVPSSRPHFHQSPQVKFNSHPHTALLASPAKQPTNVVSTCPICKELHPLFSCTKFLELTPQQRWDQVRQRHLCLNCLRAGHGARFCRSRKCKICGHHHNTLLHKAKEQSTNQPKPDMPMTSNVSNSLAVTVPHMINPTSFTVTTQPPSTVHLSTAVVNIVDQGGNSVQARALLDSGSQCSFISQHICSRLTLKSSKLSVPIAGIGATRTHASSRVSAVIRSVNSDYSEEANFIVLQNITNDIPAVPFDISKLDLPPHVFLADPTFNSPLKIDLLIGADLFWNILGNNDLSLPDHNIRLRDTRLGWIVVGCSSSHSSHTTCCHTTLEHINVQLQNFWELENENALSSNFSDENKECESHYLKTTSRDSTGRYIVQLPFKINPSNLGSSRDIAMKRFLSLERRLKTNKGLHEQYVKFMREYLTLGHMVPLSTKDLEVLPSSAYFLPHHPVFKDSSSTTKVRVVFDASSKTNNGLSLNDILYSGPVVQEDLFSIIIRARLHNIVICADIEKMYRQIWIHPPHSNYLLIYWREAPDDELKIYKLVTITYGTTCAPYQATRTLHQLAMDEEVNFPLASQIIKRDFYVDDLMTGCETHEDAINLYRDLSNIMKRGGFHIRKWSSNSSQLLNNIAPEEHAIQSPVILDCDAKHKTLGLVWDPRNDSFCFYFNDSTQHFTKRTILSVIARIFDPLGLIGPLISRAKMFMQRLWILSLNWDDEVGEPLLSDWTIFYNSLHHLNQLIIHRQITPAMTQKTFMELHGFSDASERAFGACVYLRSVDQARNIIVRLICSKSRVAPLKSQTIPRLELCGALLLATLIERVHKALKISCDTYYWTDSTITLHWLAASPTRWTTFVRNRVAKVQELTPIKSWRHISGKENPADLISRGMNGADLVQSQMWWKGPFWLSEDNDFWKNPLHFNLDDTLVIPDKCSEPSIAMLAQVNHPLTDLINRCSYTRILHTTAYCLRFGHNSRQNNTRHTGPLSPSELNTAQLKLMSYVQRYAFSQEMKDLSKQGQVAKSSKLFNLSPFCDSLGLIRVGGRLQNSSLTSDQKHPIVLPTHDRFTQEFIRCEHLRLLHAGPQALLNSIRQRFWLLNGRSQVRKIVRSCLQCFKAKPIVASQLMGQLPSARVRPSRPFLHTGVDYCGPVYLKMSPHRRCKPTKAYIALFVCFATKAIHLEVVEDMTASSFIGALRRFIARRGKPSHLYSDNGTNFVGAQKELKEIKHIWNSLDKLKVTTFSSEEGINWSFLPPRAPNFGGLWEAGVKLVKYHLRRIFNNSFNFTQFSTILTQIESCINSRPLTPLSSDPSDLLPLTPAHFLIHDTFLSLPEPDLKQVNENCLDKWEKAQQIVQHFWARWNREYLNELQQKSKWKIQKQNIEVDTLVLIKEDNIPPMTWRLGRVVQVHPGLDNKVRVVTLKTTSGLLQRPISKICPLPTSDDKPPDHINPSAEGEI